MPGQGEKETNNFPTRDVPTCCAAVHLFIYFILSDAV